MRFDCLTKYNSSRGHSSGETESLVKRLLIEPLRGFKRGLLLQSPCFRLSFQPTSRKHCSYKSSPIVKPALVIELSCKHPSLVRPSRMKWLFNLPWSIYFPVAWWEFTYDSALSLPGDLAPQHMAVGIGREGSKSISGNPAWRFDGVFGISFSFWLKPSLMGYSWQTNLL